MRVAAPTVTEVAGALAVHVDVHARAHLAGLVEYEVGDRQGAQRVAERRAVDAVLLLPARVRREQAGEDDYCHAVEASIERIGGRCRAASTTSSCRSA